LKRQDFVRSEMPTDKRTTRTLDRNRAGTRGKTSVKRGERKQGIALDERGQEQPADRGRAQAHHEGGLNKPAPRKDRGQSCGGEAGRFCRVR